MGKFREIVLLELKALVRSRTLALLLIASVAWMLVFPRIVRGDGTAESVRELTVHFSLGGVFALLVVALLASATGSLARERTAKRLQLTLVRPVRSSVIVLGKLLAHVAVGALVLAVACGILAGQSDLGARCYSVLSPILPSPREEAKVMYEAYMKDPATPEAVKKTKKEIVLRLLENRAADHFQTLPTNAVTTWKFPLCPAASDVRVRMRFAAQYDTRQDVRGRFRIGDCQGVVSNITQAVLTIPLISQASQTSQTQDRLSFVNEGMNALMLRPRKDINVLVGADGFGWNLVRAYAVLVALLAAVVAFGLFLSAGLGRPVALFVAFVTLAVSEMSPSVLEQYPDELETKAIDRIGLVLTRCVASATKPLSAVSPLEALAKDERVEPSSVIRLAAVDLVAVPLVLALLSALVLPRKQDDLV